MMNHKHIFSLFVAVVSTLSCASMVGMLRWAGAEMNIWEAARTGDLKYMERFFDSNKDVSVDLRDKGGNTLLHWTALYRHLEVVKYLIEKGSSVDVQDNDDWSPLHFAAQFGHLDAVKQLVEKGATVDLKGNKYGKTPLHCAAASGHLDVVKYLCKQFKFKTSSPHANWQRAQKLLAFLRSKDKEGKTALDIAKERNKQMVVDYLTQLTKEAEAVKYSILTALKEEQKVDTTFSW